MAARRDQHEAANPVFAAKRDKILESLSLPSSQYADASPKGSVDAEIRELIDQLNASETCVTTSSCAGRLAIFLEAAGAAPTTSEPARSPAGFERDTLSGATPRAPADLAASKPQASTGGIKGAGGRWLFVSHAPIDARSRSSSSGQHPAPPQQSLQRLFGLEAGAAADDPAETDASSQRYVHLKFEPMILHILTADLATAQAILAAGQQAGFRESGVSNVTSACPMVAIRCQGLALDCIVGELRHTPGTENELIRPLVSESHLAMLVHVVNARFQKNSERISRFAEFIRRHAGDQRCATGTPWEEAPARKERMRAEGLQRQRQVRAEVRKHDSETEDLVEGLQLGIET